MTAEPSAEKPDKGAILVVDDNEEFRSFVKRTLDSVGYQVSVAEDGPEAIRATIESDFDLVISDINMPGMTGTELLQNIKEAMPDLPVIIVTGYGNKDVAIEALKHGAYDFLEKPFRMQQLVAAVTRAMESSAARKMGRVVRERLAGVADELQSNSEGYMCVNENGQVLFVSDAIARMLNVEVDEFLGRSIVEFIRSEVNAETLLKTASNWERIEVGLEGNVREVDFRSFHVLVEEGGFYIVEVRDISQIHDLMNRMSRLFSDLS
jgi:FixJ family two-component response regulator